MMNNKVIIGAGLPRSRNDMRSSIIKIVTHPTFWIPVITVILYIMGRAYHIGMLFHFYIDERLFPMDLPTTLFEGATASWNFLYIWLLSVIILGIVMVIVLFWENWLYSKSDRKINQKITADVKIAPKKPWTERVATLSLAVMLIGFTIFTSLLACDISSKFGLSSAEDNQKKWDAAFQKLEDCKKDNTQCETISTLRIQELTVDALNQTTEKYTGFIIDGNQHYLAFYSKEAGVLIKPYVTVRAINHLSRPKA